MAEWNPFSHPIVDNPFPIYRELRDNQPVYRNEKMDFYALSRFDDVLHGLLHPNVFKSSHGITLEGLDSPDQLLNKDDPEHIYHRKIVANAFKVSSIATLEEKIRKLAANLLDRAGEQDLMDVLDDFSIMMPAAIISDMLGIPEQYRMEFLEHAKLFDRRRNRRQPRSDRGISNSRDARVRTDGPHRRRGGGKSRRRRHGRPSHGRNP